jgi:drug/metabolite transporter (DMT)-like permease
LTASLKDHLHLHFIVILWGFTAILGLLIRIPALELVFLRTLLASAGLWAVIFIYRLHFQVGMPDFLKLAGTGILISGHWLLFFGSARFSNASVCLAGLATTTFWTSILEPVLKRKRMEPLELFFGLTVIGGLYLIFHFEFGYAIGLLMSVGAAFLGSLFTVINSKITHRHNQYVISFYEMIAANIMTGIFILVMMLLYPGSSLRLIAPAPMDWIYLATLAFVCTVYPFAVAVELMKRISAFTVNLAVNLEPVYGILLAVLIFGESEKMNPGFYSGTLVILISVVGYPVIRKRFNKRKLH